MTENIEKESFISSKYIIIFYFLSFGIAWIFWVPMALNHLELIHFKIPLIVGQSIGAFAPLLSVFIIDRLTKNRYLFSNYFKSIKRTKKQISLAIFAALQALIIASLISIILWAITPDKGLNILKSNMMDKFGFLIIGVILIQFITSMVGSPLGEEIGWRGFALTNLTNKTGRILASAIVGTLWWLWHIPLFLVLEVPVNIYSYLEILGFSFIIDTLFLYANNNLFIAMLCHQSTNTKFTFFASRTSSSIGLTVLWIVGIFLFFIFRKAGNSKGFVDENN